MRVRSRLPRSMPPPTTFHPPLKSEGKSIINFESLSFPLASVSDLKNLHIDLWRWCKPRSESIVLSNPLGKHREMIWRLTNETVWVPVALKNWKNSNLILAHLFFFSTDSQPSSSCQRTARTRHANMRADVRSMTSSSSWQESQPTHSPATTEAARSKRRSPRPTICKCPYPSHSPLECGDWASKIEEPNQIHKSTPIPKLHPSSFQI